MASVLGAFGGLLGGGASGGDEPQDTARQDVYKRQALYHAECMASYSALVTVNSSGSSTLKATVMSASFEMMQPFSTAKSGNFLSSVDRKSTRLNSSHRSLSRMPSSA